MSSSNRSPTPNRDRTPQIPSDASYIEVGMGHTTEEELYAAAEALRDRAAARAVATSAPASESSGQPGSGSNSGSGSGSGSSVSAPFAFDSDMSKYPASMTSSIRDHVYEGGLRYHAYRAGKYAFPNDETEQNRDDMKHTMTLMLCHGAFFYSPVEEVLEAGAEVLDLGELLLIFSIHLPMDCPGGFHRTGG